ncbi:MAG: hypothetical protein ACLQVI_01325 [Polyangiaceae bacterium]
MVARATVDSPPPPPPPPPPAYVYAATDERPRTPHEVELCKKASTTDWLYLASGVVLTAGSIALDTELRSSASEGVRYLGPSAVGLTWGFTFGGAYLALPKCSPDYVASHPPEGDVRTDWEIAIAFAALSGLTAPVVVAIESGTAPEQWSNTERVMRLALASALGIGGSLLPYLLPPKTWRAAKELEHLRAAPTDDGRGAYFSWRVRF